MSSPEIALEWEFTPDERRELRESFVRLIPHSHRAAHRVYDCLRDAHSEIGARLGNDHDATADRLVQTLAFLVDRVDQPEALRSECRALGQQHAECGLPPDLYPDLGRLLLEEFGRECRPAMTDAERSAWTRFYDRISALMRASHPA